MPVSMRTPTRDVNVSRYQQTSKLSYFPERTRIPPRLQRGLGGGRGERWRMAREGEKERYLRGRRAPGGKNQSIRRSALVMVEWSATPDNRELTFFDLAAFDFLVGTYAD